MTKERLCRAKELIKKATPGPYIADTGNGAVESLNENYRRMDVVLRADLGDRMDEHKVNRVFYPDLPELPPYNDNDLYYAAEAMSLLPELINAYEKAVGMLRKLEWSGSSYGGDEICPLCGKRSHAPDCELKKILEG